MLPRSRSTTHPASFTLLKAPAVLVLLGGFGGHLQKKKKEEKKQSFEVLAHLKRRLTSEWSETLGVRSLRGANLTPHYSTLSLSHHHCHCCEGWRRRRRRSRWGGQTKLDHHHYQAEGAEQDALLTCCPNQTGADI